MDPSRTAATAALYNVALQVAFRGITFGVNAYVLRCTTAEILGTVNVRLTLLYSTILFLSREAVRKAVLSGSQQSWLTLRDFVSISFSTGLLWTSAISFVWAVLLQQPDVANYRAAVVVFGVSALVELATEPFWLLTQTHMLPRLKVVAESVALIVRSLVVVVGLEIFPGLEAFCLAQLLYAGTMLAAYAVLIVRQARQKTAALPCSTWRDFLPSSLGCFLLSGHPLALRTRYREFARQSLLKQFLTEGERYFMTFFNELSLAEQGIFDVVSNLGALPARMLFMPVEESYFTFFATLLRTADSPKAGDGTSESKETGEVSASNREVAATTLTGLLRAAVAVGLVMAVFGQTYAWLALHLYGGTLLSGGSGPALLQALAVYLLLLAVNGISELFAVATSSISNLQTSNKLMVVFSIVFLAVAVLLTPTLGSMGLVIANIVNMLCRIIRSCWLTAQYFAKYPTASPHPLRALLPSLPLTISLLFAYFVTSLTAAPLQATPTLSTMIVHVAVGAVALVGTLVTVVLLDKELVAALRAIWQRRAAPKTE
eukprot:m.12234 g.12234  ORF g.12234 m.12234 type:complete len:545 (-) comp5976_c0_seq1:62-1696(-)